MNADDLPVDEQEIKVRLPHNLVQRLERNVHVKDRNRWIRDAIEQQLRLEEQFAALEETAASWMKDDATDTLPPEDEVIHWLRDVSENGGRPALFDG